MQENLSQWVLEPVENMQNARDSKILTAMGGIEFLIGEGGGIQNKGTDNFEGEGTLHDTMMYV